MLNKLTDIGGKLAQILGDKTNLGVSSVAAQTPFMESAMLANFLHYEAFDQDTNIYINKNSCGFILEVTALIGTNEEAASILSSLITDVLPDNTDLQFLLWGSNKVGDLLDQFEAERSGRGEIFEWLAKKRIDFLKAGVNDSLISSGSFVLRDFRLFIVISVQEKTSTAVSMKLMELRDSITSSLKSINMQSHNLGAEAFLNLMNDLINPSTNIHPAKQKWNQYDSLSLQLTDQEYKTTVFPNCVSFENEEEKIEARALTVKSWPSEAKFGVMADSIGQLFNASLQIPSLRGRKAESEGE